MVNNYSPYTDGEWYCDSSYTFLYYNIGHFIWYWNGSKWNYLKFVFYATNTILTRFKSLAPVTAFHREFVTMLSFRFTSFHFISICAHNIQSEERNHLPKSYVTESWTIQKSLFRSGMQMYIKCVQQRPGSKEQQTNKPLTWMLSISAIHVSDQTIILYGCKFGRFSSKEGSTVQFRDSETWVVLP